MNNKYLQGVVGVLALVLIIFVAAEARNAFQQYNYIGTVPHDRDTITVEGTGKISATPDVAVVQLGVQTDGTTVKDTQSVNTKKMNDISAAVKALGVADKDIQTSNYSIYPKVDYANGKQSIIGYTVSQQVTVKVRNLDTVGDVLGKAGELGANQVGGMQFTIDDPTALQSQARTKAIADAKSKAEALASQLGLSIVRVVTFSENSGNVQPPMPMMYAAKDMAAGAEATAPSIESGSLDVNSTVDVTFQIR